MSDSSDTPHENKINLSSEYWNLHRNSMLISSALFLACLVKDDSPIKIFDVELGRIGAGGLTLILTLSSVYAYLTLYFEWKEEAREIYRTNIKKAKTTLDEITISVRKLNSLRERIEKVIDKSDSLQSEAEWRHFARDDIFKKSRDIWKERYDERSSMHTEDGGHRDSKETSHRINVELSNFEGLISNQIVEVLRSQIHPDIRYTKETFDGFTKSFNKFNDHMKKEIRYFNFSGIFKSKIYISSQWVRLVVLGLIVPSFVFANGLLHGIFRLIWGTVPSWTESALLGIY